MSLESNRLCDRRLSLFSRRDVLRHSACGFGWLALCDLATRTRAAETGVVPSEAQPRTHFQHFFLTVQVSGQNDLFQQAVVEQKILPQALFGRNAVPIE